MEKVLQGVPWRSQTVLYTFRVRAAGGRPATDPGTVHGLLALDPKLQEVARPPSLPPVARPSSDHKAKGRDRARSIYIRPGVRLTEQSQLARRALPADAASPPASPRARLCKCECVYVS